MYTHAHTHTHTIYLLEILQTLYKHSVVVSLYCMKKVDIHLYDTYSFVICSMENIISVRTALLTVPKTVNTRLCPHKYYYTETGRFSIRAICLFCTDRSSLLFRYEWLCCVQSSDNTIRWRWKYVLLTNQQTDQLIPRSRTVLGKITAPRLVKICVLTDPTTYPHH